MFKKLFIYIVLVTVVFAHLDFDKIHQSYLKYGKFPNKSVDVWWPAWSTMRYNLALFLCPPCGAFAEHYYFVLFEVEAGIDEQNELLFSHIPPGNYEGVLSLHGFWWGQGGENNSNPWKRVSLLSWYLYWLPYTVIWWWLYAGDIFNGRLPFWLRWLLSLRLPSRLSSFRPFRRPSV